MAALANNKTAAPSGALALGVGMTSFGLAYAALALTREVGSVPSIWPLNAVVVVVLLRAPRSVWWSLVLALILGNAAARLVNGDGIQPAALLSLANGMETLIAATFLNRSFTLRLSKWDGALRFIGVSILACVTSTTLASMTASCFQREKRHIFAGVH